MEAALAQNAARPTLREIAEAFRAGVPEGHRPEDILPLSNVTTVIFVAGEGANDIGLQSGGWTLEWQGKTGNDNQGTTLFSAIKAAVDSGTRVEFNRDADFREFRDADGNPLLADVGIVVLAEKPYAEGVGDRADLSLSESDIKLLEDTKEQSRSLLVILVSGRPRVITEQLDMADAWVAAWWSAAFPGMGHLLHGSYVKGFIFFAWEFIINIGARINEAMVYSFTGQFELAKATLDTRWVLLYIAVYIISIWDSYRTSVDINKIYISIFNQ